MSIKKRRRISELLASMLSITFIITFASCSVDEYDPLEGKNVVQSLGGKEVMGSFVADINNIEATTELSTQIVKCKILDMEKIDVYNTSNLNFLFNAEIEEVYFDVNSGIDNKTSDSLSAGDKIVISTGDAVVKATVAAEALKGKSDAKFLTMQSEDYKENDYIVCSMWDSIPVEAGNSYILYLTDEFLESEGAYTEVGRMFTWGILNGDMYYGVDFIKSDMSLSEVEAQIAENVANRTGRVDQIGRNEYLTELGKLQAEEYNKNLGTVDGE